MNFFWLAALLALSTFASRAIPAILIGKVNFSDRARKFLELIPITSMTALVVPSVFSTDPQYVSIGIIGSLTAAAAAWFKLPVIACVLLSVLSVFICYQTGFLF
ncbi:AzlD domain-containing protein [Allobaculum mucilyticum]|uniref:AzlD domain-containing protein n=1 Tax=Allobaculum mucilyticum TaxID=2834459 RepID=UPI001E659EA4|nr:AzlD domain-containing protein [Allobaculum mucilyticum]UNT96104.1 AzlD domain-containing protein [Allobaculum mucilyticum]